MTLQGFQQQTDRLNNRVASLIKKILSINPDVKIRRQLSKKLLKKYGDMKTGVQNTRNRLAKFARDSKGKYKVK